MRDDDWKAMEGALGRRLTPTERDRVVDAIELHAHIIHTSREARAPAQDVRATLLAISRLGDADIGNAYEAADVTTRALLDKEMLPHRRSIASTPEALRAAATAVLAGGVARAPKGDSHALLARTIAMLWRDLGGAGGATVNGEYASPMTRFAQAAFAAAGEPISSHGAAARIARATAGEEN